MLTDPVTLLRTMPPGSMLYGGVRLDEGEWETALYGKEERKFLKRLGENPTLDIRSGLFQGPDVWPGVVMLSPVGHTKAMLYESWLNWHAPEQQETIRRFATQERLVTFWYDEHMQLARTLAVPHTRAKAVAVMVSQWERSNPGVWPRSSERVTGSTNVTPIAERSTRR